MTVSRRRFLAISAATVMTAEIGYAAPPVARWRGHAMGAPTSMQLAGLGDVEARPVFTSVERELARLERIFSLYRGDSQLVQLNETGMLRAPAPELLEVLSLCDRLHDVSGGVFDPTVQPLWRCLGTQGQKAPDLDAAQALVGWPDVKFAASEIRLGRPGMALTLNGIAQGYVTDRIRALLIDHGLTDALVDMGEIAALGTRPDGTGWRAGVALPDGQVVHRVTLTSRALATSAPQGTVLDAKTGLGHIIDPRSPGRRPRHGLVSVSAPQAALADGLSTAGCLLPAAELAQVIGSFPDTALETTM